VNIMTNGVFYNKLVRDNILDIIEGTGKKYQAHIADDHEYRECLVKKLQEELDEFRSNSSGEEAADILEVAYSLFSYHGLNLAGIENVRLSKLKKRGGFTKRIILEKVID
jgi:predicted house-cleaning noncanonical NTP pyrophosphatase (MazG superfamily)